MDISGLEDLAAYLKIVISLLRILNNDFFIHSEDYVQANPWALTMNYEQYSDLCLTCIYSAQDAADKLAAIIEDHCDRRRDGTAAATS